ncbi:serine/threonine-protein kinase [Gemmatimonas sp.]|uniref:serine/threonine-protein kinase n=1 Tax=Gemmatimonas sp. TaxID=1962908 RepID=UPI0022C856CF|nr:serine/threonine-protein kinase [Gemmatimonas sp.]MCZ8205102.1 serine/threonine-protein kinase [Gemmatimonas sp.]
MTDFLERLQRALAPGFHIDRELGGAGMSRVFVATERALNRTVVVKVLPPELAAGVNVERFRREIQLAAQLQHPHIVPLIAAGDDHGLLWFSMPYIEGESLRGTLARHGRLSPRDVVRILHDVVDALAYAHGRGVVHRDIKPDNILTSGMHALVTDFGVAKALSASGPGHSGTSTGLAIGTPAYMAPEQLAADPAADHRVDLYAVGLLAYELLTGKGPFSGSSPQATLAAQLTVMPEPPHRTVSDIPEPLSRLIMHCLAKDAAKRPQTAQALLATLEALPPMPGQTLGVRGPSSVFARARRARALGAAGAVALLGALLWAVVPDRTPPRGVADALEARDAGPGGRTGTPLTAPTEPTGGVQTDSSAALRLADEAAMEAVTPFVITRAESLAIAAAVTKRQRSAEPRGAAPTAPAGDSTRIDRALLLAEVGRIFADSMTRAIREMEVTLASAPRFVRPEMPPADAGSGGRSLVFDARSASRPNMPVAPLMAPPADGRLRVVVAAFTNATGKREVSALARSAASELREAIPADRFEVVPADLTERATRTLPDKMSVGWALRADYVVSGWLIARGDSVAMVTMLTDVRSGRFTRALETVTTADATSMEQARKQMSVWLDTAATIAARRRTAETVRR